VSLARKATGRGGWGGRIEKDREKYGADNGGIDDSKKRETRGS